jgi:hypothetical protein
VPRADVSEGLKHQYDELRAALTDLRVTKYNIARGLESTQLLIYENGDRRSAPAN